jgi:hypothetical protein
MPFEGTSARAPSRPSQCALHFVRVSAGAPCRSALQSTRPSSLDRGRGGHQTATEAFPPSPPSSPHAREDALGNVTSPEARLPTLLRQPSSLAAVHVTRSRLGARVEIRLEACLELARLVLRTEKKSAANASAARPGQSNWMAASTREAGGRRGSRYWRNTAASQRPWACRWASRWAPGSVGTGGPRGAGRSGGLLGGDD